jgi:transposase-like protein
VTAVTVVTMKYGLFLKAVRQSGRTDSGEREGLTTEEKAELRRLRREVKTLRQEKEILRKAGIYGENALKITSLHGML